MAKKRLSIPTGAADFKSMGFIPEKATNQRNPSDPEVKCFNVGHKFYNEKLCELKGMTASPLKSVLDKYKKISMYTTVMELRQSLSFKRVNNSGHYSDFYRGLDDDIEIEEFKLADGCRTFFFINQSLKLVEVIAISRHPEENKQKR